MADLKKFFFIISFIAILILNYLLFQELIPNMSQHIALINIFAITIIFGLYWFVERVENPRDIVESIDTAKKAFGKIKYGSKNVGFDIQPIEAARYKEKVLKTKKDVVHSIVFEDPDDTSKAIIFKDDPFIKNPHSLVGYFRAFFKPKVYDSKAEVEREARFIPLSPPKPTKKKSKEVKTEEIKTT